jgi:hypothetical protein
VRLEDLGGADLTGRSVHDDQGLQRNVDRLPVARIVKGEAAGGGVADDLRSISG